jgi:hypothetical protein
MTWKARVSLTGPDSQVLKQKTRLPTRGIYKNFGGDNSRQLVARDYMTIECNNIGVIHTNNGVKEDRRSRICEYCKAEVEFKWGM